MLQNLIGGGARALPSPCGGSAAGAAAQIGLGLIQQAYGTVVDVGIGNGGELLVAVEAAAAAQSGPAGALAGIERAILQIARPLGDDAEAAILFANTGVVGLLAAAVAAGTAASASSS